jgi:hypothetical protein
MRTLRFLLGTFVLVAAVGPSAQTTKVPSDPVRAIVDRLELERYKAHIKGLSRFGDRMQGTPRNRDAINWLEKELRSFGYADVERHRFVSGGEPLENIYATKTGMTVPREMYIVSAHMDGRGGGEAADDDASGCAIVLELARVLGMADVRTDRSVRFMFWNNEEFGMDGSGTYAIERSPLQGTVAEPKWLGVIQHDMMLFDHGMLQGRTRVPTPISTSSIRPTPEWPASPRSWRPRCRRRTGCTPNGIARRLAPTWPAPTRSGSRILWPRSACVKTRGSRA